MEQEYMKEQPEPVAPFDPERVYRVPMNLIFADEEFNCRGHIDPLNVIELSKDIEKNDLDQPITIRPLDEEKNGKKFQLVAGFRRFKAHQIIKAKTIRAQIRALSDVDARFHNLRENLQRENLNIKQEALALAKLRFLPKQEVANRVSMSYGWVQTRLYLLDLPEEIQDEAAAGNLTQSEIRKCAALHSPEDQYAYVRALKDAKLKDLVRAPEPKENVNKKKNESRLRTREEIYEMQDLIREQYGNGLATSLLAWVAGNIDDLEIHQRIKADAAERGTYYEIPEGLEPVEVQ